MSTVSLPSYVAPSLTTPSYSAEPHESEQRIALAERSYPRPSGIFVKSSKKGDARLRLNAQEDNIELPVYGSQGCVEGTIELSKTEHITSVEAKIEGRLRLNEIAEGGTASAKLCQCTVVLWTRENNYSVCPTSFAFAFRLPTTFTNEGKTYPLPPTFRVKLSGLPGFTASVKYSVSAIIGKPHRVPLVKSSVLTIPSRPHVVTTPFIYYPRTRPAAPIPASLFPACRGFLANEEWQLYESKIRARNPAVPDITSTLYIPATRIFCISQPIPFYLSLKSPALSLASFLLPTPTSSSLEAKQAMRIQLMRQSTVDVRNTIIAGTKTDMWRVDCIGEALLKHVDDGPSWVSYSGEINIHKNVKVGGFRAAGLNVKDWILFSMTPPNPKRSPFGDLRQTIPIRLTTDPWTGDGTSMRIPSSRSVSWYSVPSLPDDSVVLRSCMT